MKLPGEAAAETGRHGGGERGRTKSSLLTEVERSGQETAEGARAACPQHPRPVVGELSSLRRSNQLTNFLQTSEENLEEV